MWSLSWEHNSYSFSQDISHSLLNPKVHYCVYKTPQPWAGEQSLQTTLLFLQDILILSSHLYLCLPSGLFPSGFPTKTLYIFLFYSMCATCSTHFIFLDITILIYYIWNTVCKLTITANDANFWSTVKPSYNIYGKENNRLGLFTEKRSENIL